MPGLIPALDYFEIQNKLTISKYYDTTDANQLWLFGDFSLDL
jgi:hypothetical protein